MKLKPTDPIAYYFLTGTNELEWNLESTCSIDLSKYTSPSLSSSSALSTITGTGWPTQISRNSTFPASFNSISEKK